MTDVNRGQRTISPPEKIKIVAEMKNLHVEEKALQAQKIARQTQLEPLQEKEEQLIMEIDAGKACLEHIGLEGGDILRPLVTAQVVKSMSARSIQA